MIIIIINDNLVVVRCRIAPTANSVPVKYPSNWGVAMNMPKVKQGEPTRAPYTVNFYRANTNVVIASVAPNIAWAQWPLI